MSRASVETYIKQLQIGALENNDELVYRAIKNSEGATIKSLRHLLPHQTLTSRISKLQDLGVLFENGVKREGNISYSKLYTEENLNKIKLNREKRKKERFLRWLKKGAEYNEFLDPFINTSLSVLHDSIIDH